MRPFETATVLLLVVAWGSYLVPRHKRPRWLFVLPALAAVAAVVQLVVEGYRWQMVPASALAAVLFIVGVPPFLRKAEPAPIPMGSRHRIAGRTLGFLALIIAMALPVALPVFHLPPPTGPYAVGTTTLELVDPSRPEMYPPNTKAHRDLLVQVWYPAERVSGARPQPYLPDAFGSFLATSLNRPGFVLNYQSVIQTHSSKDVPVAHARPRYPVLIFSPGDAGIVQQYTVQMEELSSDGYVVFGINHPYTAAVVVYPDGRTVSRNPPHVSSPEALQSWLENSLKVWTQDTRFVLDELERLNRGERPSLFAGRLDLNRIGIFGHSFGGTTAGEVCVLDSRCKAVVNLDGPPARRFAEPPNQATVHDHVQH